MVKPPFFFTGQAIPMSKFELRDDEISGKRGFVLEHNGYDEGPVAMWGRGLGAFYPRVMVKSGF